MHFNRVSGFWLTLEEQSLRTIQSSSSSNVAPGILVDLTHQSTFMLPIFLRVLDDAQTIDPNVAEP
jgi:hypothetical protein